MGCVSSCENEIILVVCGDAERSTEILRRLHEGGANVLGPVSTAGLALALTAQVTPRSAILVGQTTGRRSAETLARELFSLWGVECYVLPPEDHPAEAWESLSDVGRVATLRRILRSGGLRPAPLH